MNRILSNLLMILLALTSFVACDDKDDNNDSPNNNSDPLTGSWLYTSPITTHSLIFSQDKLKSIQTVTSGPISNKNILEGPYMILSSGTIVSLDVTSATQNDSLKPEWLGERFYIAGLYSEDSLQFLEAEKWERISGNPESLTGGKFHRYSVSEDNGITNYNHYRIDFNPQSITIYSTVTQSAILPEEWDIENTSILVIQDDHYYYGGNTSNSSYFRLDGGNLYLSDYLPSVIFKKL